MNTDFENAYAEALAVVQSAPRRAAVHATGLLDTEVEESFDRLTRLAVRLLNKLTSPRASSLPSRPSPRSSGRLPRSIGDS